MLPGSIIISLLSFLLTTAPSASAFLSPELSKLPTLSSSVIIDHKSSSGWSLASSYLDNLGCSNALSSQTSSSPPPPAAASASGTTLQYVPVLSLDQADDIANHVIAVCRRNQFNPVTVYVLDAGGSTLVSKRMDGCAPVGIPEFAHAKANSCIVNQYPSRAFRDRYTSVEASAKFGQMLSMVAISGGTMAPFPGGILLQQQLPDGKPHLVGAVGVSGAAGDEDEYCAITAVREANFPGLSTVPAEHSCSTVNEPSA